MPEQTIHLADYTAYPYSFDRVELDFDLGGTRTVVRARLYVSRTSANKEPLVLDGEELETLRVAIDGRELEDGEYTATEQQLTIHSPPASFVLETTVAIHPDDNAALMGLYTSGGRLCTQCESQGFRRITWYPDRPDVLSTFTVRLESDRANYPTLLSNGNLIDSGELTAGRHFAQWHDPFPKPAYLFALVAGEFETIRDSFTTMSGEEVALFIHVDEGNGERVRFAMDVLKRSMKWDEERFGREYDLGQFHIVAVRDFNYGAMENKSLNIFNASAVLAHQATETDADFTAVERIVAHEYFHNWTGNRITLRDWFQLCLKEGLTVYRDQEFMADQHSPAVQRIRNVSHLRDVQFPEDAGPLAHPVRPESFVRIENFYTPTVYRKGAEVIRALENWLGRDRFDSGMQRYFESCDGRAVTVEEFVGCFASEQVDKSDLEQFFRWYRQAGTPHLTVSRRHDAKTSRLELTITQSTAPTPGQEEKYPLLVPLRAGFISPSGESLALRIQGGNAAHAEHRLLLQDKSARFVFEDAPADAIPAVLRGFGVPVTIDDGLTEAERLAQMMHEPDPFTRWDAGQQLLVSCISALADGPDKGELPENEQALATLEKIIDALARELDRSGEDPAFAAFTLGLPTLGNLVQKVEKPNLERLSRARGLVRRRIAARLEERLLALVRGSADVAQGNSARARGERALLCTAIRQLASAPGDHAQLLLDLFGKSDNMTVQLTSLRALAHIGGEHYERALDEFAEQWKDQPLVIDKWFAVQATARNATADTIRKLADHPLFELRNPNRVRALYGSFGNSNLRAFHATDGSGYELLSEVAIEVDRFNPMVAGRLIRAFESWKKLGPDHREKARDALQRVRGQKNLSPMLSELVDKLLG